MRVAVGYKQGLLIEPLQGRVASPLSLPTLLRREVMNLEVIDNEVVESRVRDSIVFFHPLGCIRKIEMKQGKRL